MSRKKNKPVQDSTMERVPPYLPLVWQEWISSIDIQKMSTSEEGIYLRLLLALWQYDQLVDRPAKIAQMVRIPDTRTLNRWLGRYGHLLAGEKQHTPECLVNLREIYRNLPVNSLETSCECTVTLRSEKLRILKENAQNRGVCSEDQTEPNQTEPKKTSVSHSASNQETPTDVGGNEKLAEQVERGSIELIDLEVPVNELPCYAVLHEEFGVRAELPERPIREIHTVLSKLGEDENWMRGCLRWCFDHRKFWSKCIVRVSSFADSLVKGLDDPDAKQLPAQYNRFLSSKHRTAGAGGKR